jgi:hypothetical protein
LAGILFIVILEIFLEKILPLIVILFSALSSQSVIDLISINFHFFSLIGFLISEIVVQEAVLLVLFSNKELHFNRLHQVSSKKDFSISVIFHFISKSLLCASLDKIVTFFHLGTKVVFLDLVIIFANQDKT